MKKIVLLALSYSVIVLLCMFAIDVKYRQLYKLDFDPPRNVLPAPEISEKYQIVKVGNSHAQDGISFDGFKLKSLDVSGVAQKYETDVALLKHYTRQIGEDAIIIIPVTPISFSHTKPKNEKGFQALYYGRISPIFIPNLDIGEYIESEFLSFVRAGYYWRKAYGTEVKERIAQEEKWIEPENETIELDVEPSPMTAAKPTQNIDDVAEALEPTSTPVPHYLKFKSIEDALASPSSVPNVLAVPEYADNVNFTYTKWNHTDEFSLEAFEKNQSDLQTLLKYAKDQGWQPVLIMIPITFDLAKALPADYMQTYVMSNLAQLDTDGVPLYDLSNDPRITTNTALFANSDHLNPYGKMIVSYHLLQKLIGDGYLSSDQDGYVYE